MPDRTIRNLAESLFAPQRTRISFTHGETNKMFNPRMGDAKMMTTFRAELWKAVREDPEHVVVQCRRLKKAQGSGAVRARLAHLAEYAELLAERRARGADKPIAWVGQLDGMDE